MKAAQQIRGYVFYDAECGFCTSWSAKMSGVLAKRGLHLIPLQLPWAKQALHLPEDAPLTEMKLLMGDGRIFGGAEAGIQIARQIWWAWPVFALAAFPGVRPLLNWIYRMIAKNRHCLIKTGLVPHVQPAVEHHITASFYDLP